MSLLFVIGYCRQNTYHLMKPFITANTSFPIRLITNLYFGVTDIRSFPSVSYHQRHYEPAGWRLKLLRTPLNFISTPIEFVRYIYNTIMATNQREGGVVAGRTAKFYYPYAILKQDVVKSF